MILRPLFLFLTIAAVVLALVTTTGRVFVALLPRFESQINALLVPFAVELSGLKGEWRNLNPVIYVDSARFSGGRARGFRIEVDLLGSAANNTLVAERLHIDELNEEYGTKVPEDEDVETVGGYVALRLGDPDAFPETDLGVVKALRSLGIEDRERIERWRPWRGYATLYLWRSL